MEGVVESQGPKDSTRSSEGASFPMNSGDGPNSYIRNSKYQKEVGEQKNSMVAEAIKEHLQLASVPSVLCIADLGCSVGSNTLSAVKTCVDAVGEKYGSSSSDAPPPMEFLVLFNDHASSDFNTLFSTLPQDRAYFAAGVPGSFYNRLFPRSSVHLMHSSFSLHWLSNVPGGVGDIDSPAWNKGRVSYTDGAAAEVGEAYLKQFGKDMGTFLRARAAELVIGGLMAIVIPSRPDASNRSQPQFDLLGCALMEMAAEGNIDESKVDSFNLPIYYPTCYDLEKQVEDNGSFSIVRMEGLCSKQHAVHFDSKMMSLQIRAGLESVITKHFGNHIIEELFKRYIIKIEQNIDAFKSLYQQPVSTFLVLKRTM